MPAPKSSTPLKCKPSKKKETKSALASTTKPDGVSPELWQLSANATQFLEHYRNADTAAPGRTYSQAEVNHTSNRSTFVRWGKSKDSEVIYGLSHAGGTVLVAAISFERREAGPIPAAWYRGSFNQKSVSPAHRRSTIGWHISLPLLFHKRTLHQGSVGLTCLLLGMPWCSQEERRTIRPIDFVKDKENKIAYDSPSSYRCAEFACCKLSGGKGCYHQQQAQHSPSVNWHTYRRHSKLFSLLSRCTFSYACYHSNEFSLLAACG